MAGLALGGGWRSLLPRRTDVGDAMKMLRYYIGLPFAWLTRRTLAASTLHHKVQRTSANRLFFYSIGRVPFPVAATGWAIHKPMQLSWLAAIFGGYNKARIWHFWLMWIFILFVVPHVVLVFADGWDTLRSMIVRLVCENRKNRRALKMNPEESHEPAEPRDASSTGAKAEGEMPESGAQEKKRLRPCHKLSLPNLQWP